MMEKYGVDKENDQIEKEAEEMVKSGECKDIDEARSIAKERDGKLRP